MAANKMAWWTGRTVRLVAEAKTRAGAVYAPGTVFRVRGHWRGRLTLDDPATGSTLLRQIPPAWVADAAGEHRSPRRAARPARRFELSLTPADVRWLRLHLERVLVVAHEDFDRRNATRVLRKLRPLPA